MINHLWGNFVDQKTLLESRDDTIVKLHAKVSQLESAAAASGKGSGAAVGAGGKKNPLSSTSHPVRVLMFAQPVSLILTMPFS